MIFALLSLAHEVPSSHAALMALPAYGLSVSYYLLPIRREISRSELSAQEGCSPPASQEGREGSLWAHLCWSSLRGLSVPSASALCSEPPVSVPLAGSHPTTCVHVPAEAHQWFRLTNIECGGFTLACF